MTSPSQRRRARTLDRIATEAFALVAEGGLEGLTMARLAARVDYTTPALYRYVPSKGALIAELNRRVLVDHRARLSVAWAEVEGPLEALRVAAEVLVAHAVERPEAFGLVAITLADPRRLVDDDLPAHVPELIGLVGELEGWLQGAADAGALAPGDAQARAVRWLFALFGTLQLAKLARFDERLRPETVTLPLARDLLAAWAPPGGPT